MLNTVVPNTSLGIRSGVNCTRLNFVSISLAIVRANSVLATPGTPSISTCPSARMAVSIKSTVSRCPTMTCDNCSLSCCTLAANSVRSSRCSVPGMGGMFIASIGLYMFLIIQFIWSIYCFICFFVISASSSATNCLILRICFRTSVSSTPVRRANAGSDTSSSLTSVTSI